LSYLNAASSAAGLTPAEKKAMEALSKTLTVHRELSNLPQKTAQQAYASKSPEQQAALKRVAGEEDPVTKPQRGWLGTAWHYTGGALLAGLTEVSDLTTRAYRAAVIPIAERGELGFAWTEANDKGDKVFNPGRIENARTKFGTDRVNVAMRVASGEKLSQIASSGTDSERQIAALAAQNKDDLFQDALDAAQAAKYSPGRQIANLVTPEQIEGSGFFYRAVSGTFDAAFRILADPLILGGKAKRLIDISRYSVDVVVGGNKVTEVFARPQVQNFWNSYGADLAAYKKAVDSGATKEAVVIKQRLTRLAPEFGDPVIKSFINTADDAVPITNVSVASLTCVAACIKLIKPPITKLVSRNGVTNNKVIITAFVANVMTKLSSIISFYLKLKTSDCANKYHPSTNTKSNNLNGNEIKEGGSIIIPIANNTLETTMSIIKKGT
jgi:hypothetical protein